MSGNAGFRISTLSLMVLACFVWPTLAPAQEASNAAGTYSSSAIPDSSNMDSRNSGLYSSESNVLTGGSALGIANHLGLVDSRATNANSTLGKLQESSSPRSTWQADSSRAGGTNRVGWTAGTISFRTNGETTWIAGGKNFELGRQQGGIWRASPASGAALAIAPHSSVLATLPSGVASPGRFSMTLTPKGAGLIKGSRFSFPSGPHSPSASGYRSSGSRLPSAQPHFGGTKNPFASHSPSSGSSSFGAGSGSVQKSPPSETLRSPSLHDTLQ